MKESKTLFNIFKPYLPLIVLSLLLLTGCPDDKKEIVDPGMPDTNPPTIMITAPTANSTVSGAITIKVSVSDDKEVVKVDFLVDGNLLGEDKSAPWEFQWDTRQLPDGRHRVRAQAHDAAGNTGSSEERMVIVANVSSAINSFIQNLPSLPDPPPPSENQIASSSEIINESGTEYQCEVKRFSLTENFEEVVVFNPNADVLWPGALVQGSTIDGGVPALISLPRTPITISIDLPVTDNRRTVANPTFGTVTSAINDLIASNGVPQIPTPARLAYFEQNAYSLEQSMLKLGVSAKWLTGSLRGSLEINKSVQKRSIVVRFTQPYYTVAFEPPTSPAAIFDSTVTVNDVQSAMSANNPPAYISSVTYGRMLIFKMTSSFSFEEMKNALKLSVNTILAGGGGSIDQQTEKILNESEATIVVLGGSAQNGIQLITNRSIIDFLKAEPNVSTESPGVPISFALKWLRDNRLAKLGATTEYETRECGVNIQLIRLTVESMKVISSCDKPGTNSEFYYQFKITAGNQVKIIEQRCSDGTRDAKPNETIVINQSRTFLLPRQNGSVFEFGGWVRDVDKGCGGSDDEQAGPQMRQHLFDVQEWEPGRHILKLTGSCSLDVVYLVELL